jgi:hypothetical protein
LLEISLHILDVVENGLAAGADLIEIDLEKDEDRDLLCIVISDNGKGMRPEEVSNVTNPFFTSRTTRRVGLGLPFLKMAAEQCDGYFNIESQIGRGTRVEVAFKLSHWDRAPLGDMAGTLLSLIVGRSDVDFIYRQKSKDDDFTLDTRDIKAAIEDIPLSDPDVLTFLRDNIREGLAELGGI